MDKFKQAVILMRRLQKDAQTSKKYVVMMEAKKAEQVVDELLKAKDHD